ncbi:hypothetical protein DFH06DRAFT_1445422 [Mycena polygramma]|nr:hypothetical protein DFH06DRAFT_1445422 [Mycena polygramma]
MVGKPLPAIELSIFIVTNSLLEIASSIQPMADPKQRFPNSLPSPVQMSGPPPYALPPSYRSPPIADWSAHPQNYIHISRTFGALRRCRFTVDPNLHVPSSLLGTPEWESSESLFSGLKSRPDPNLELAVTFGNIDADIHVLPLSASARQCATGRCRTASRLLYSRRSDSCQCPRKSNLEASTTTGNVTLRVEAAPTTHFSLRASSTFGHICIFLPRTFHGPLSIMSSLGAPNLSPELKRVCAPISEVGGARRWFVGDAGVWRDRGEHGDEALVGTTFGLVWVGYIGEEEDATRALQWGALHWVVNIVLAFLFLFLFRFLLQIFVWILAVVLAVVGII